MKNKTRFQNYHAFALTCLALTTFACTKSDSLGKVGGKDGGADGSCQLPNVFYTAPGCGNAAVPICGELPQDACLAIDYFCACDGVTTIQSRCGQSPSPFLSTGACKVPPDAAPGPDVAPAPDGSADSSCQYPSDSHVSATGDTVWTWRFHWQGVNLAAICAAWGSDAKVILEVDVPTNASGSGTNLPTCALDTLSTGAGPKCAMANAWRFEAVCTDSQILVELPSSNTFHGYYHLESTAYPNSPRHLVSQDDHCSRDLYLPTGIGSPPATTNDGGVDVASDGNTCSTGLIHYAAPGCGAAAVPTCETTGDASFSPSSFCACDGVTTLTYDARGVRTPYLYAGVCKQDGGSSVTAAETGAEAGAGCACVRPNSLTWSQTTWDCYCSIHDCTVNQAAFTASLSAYGWSTDDYANCDLRVLSFKFSGGTDMASRRIFQLSSGKMVGAFDTADTGVQCPFEAPGTDPLLGLLAGTQVDTSCVRSATSCPDAGATSCFR